MLGTAPNEVVGYRSPAVCRIVGITYRQLDYWARIDLLVPSITEARGSGSQRHYSKQDVFKLSLLKTLLDQGVSLSRARAIFEEHREIADLAARDAILVLHCGPSQLLRSVDEVSNFLKNLSGCVLVVSLGRQWEQLTALLDENEASLAS